MLSVSDQYMNGAKKMCLRKSQTHFYIISAFSPERSPLLRGNPHIGGSGRCTHPGRKAPSGGRNGPDSCRRDGLAELPLHLHRVLGPVGDAQPPGDADAVGVADIGGLAEHVPQNQIGGLSPHAGEGGEFLHGAGNLAAVPLHQLLGAGHDIPGLSVVEAAGVDVFARPRLGSASAKALQRREAGVTAPGVTMIDPRVGALGGQPHGEEQLVILLILQGAQPRPDTAPSVFR